MKRMHMIFYLIVVTKSSVSKTGERTVLSLDTDQNEIAPTINS